MPTFPLRLSWEPTDRVPVLLWLAVAVAVLGTTLAVWGPPPVDVHGPFHYVGIMDPLCGGTRALRYALRGQLSEAWRYNPLSLVVLLAAVGLIARALIGAATGQWLTVQVTSRRILTVLVVAAVIALEIRQQSLAPLLLQHN